jgi:hypothetical protein
MDQAIEVCLNFDVQLHFGKGIADAANFIIYVSQHGSP